ncbi:MAG TPA: hypothetical protein VGH58_00215 [Solirubrobacterales bacterium]|jgi:hypothetical protein
MPDLATAFEELRPQLTRVAYGILGSIGEAEDDGHSLKRRLADDRRRPHRRTRHRPQP